MVTHYDPENRRVTVYNRHGESIGVFVLRHGGWDFVPDEYRREKTLTPHEQTILDRVQMELNT